MEEKIRRLCGSFSSQYFDINLDSIEQDISSIE